MKTLTLVLIGAFTWLTGGAQSDTLAQTEDVNHIYTSVEEAIKNPEQVYYLDLSKQKLKEFPVEILKCTNLVMLDLSRNKIKTIPVGISQLTNLEELNLSRNDIVELPVSMFDLVKLKRLVLNQNSIERIPAQIKNLQQLEYLDMWHNELWDVPTEIGELKKLKEFDLRVIQFSFDEQKRINQLLPNTKILFSQSCNCGN